MGPLPLYRGSIMNYGVTVRRGSAGTREGVNVMKAAMVGKWTTPVPGREKAAIAYGRALDEFFGKKAAEGLCTEPKWFWATTGENLWLVEGEFDALVGISATPEAQKFQVMGPILLQDCGWSIFLAGREEMFGPYEEILKELKIS